MAPEHAAVGTTVRLSSRIGCLGLTQPSTLYLGIGGVACPAITFTSWAPMHRESWSLPCHASFVWVSRRWYSLPMPCRLMLTPCSAYGFFRLPLDFQLHPGHGECGPTCSPYKDVLFASTRAVHGCLVLTHPSTLYTGLGVVACPAITFSSRASMCVARNYGPYPAIFLISGYRGSGMPCHYLFFQGTYDRWWAMAAHYDLC